jgi:hypothetical protein
MSTKNIISIIIILLVIVFGFVLYKMSIKPEFSTVVYSTTSSNATTTVMKFSDEPYYTFAYEIDPNNLSSTTRQAMTGFSVTSQKNADGTITVSLTSTNTEYHNQSYNLKPEDKLYFIEKNLKDDVGGQEKFLVDDTAVVVDQNGNVVQ